MLSSIKRAIVIAPHPDDEILGCGGTIAKLIAQGTEVHIVIMTRGGPPIFTVEQIDKVLKECARAHQFLGIKQTYFLDFPAAGLDAIPIAQINSALCAVIDDVRPDTVFVPFVGDIHLDHQISFTSALVASRPRHADAPKNIYAYETLSETNWNAPGITPAFIPNMFVDISAHLDTKMQAFAYFESQVKEFPDERSLKNIEALATIRGATVYCDAAESFMIIRQILG
tara:strand:- start:2002 stop:2682 length:681 start_codon:yes stop_codon:yes gene_type:complete